MPLAHSLSGAAGLPLDPSIGRDAITLNFAGRAKATHFDAGCRPPRQTPPPPVKTACIQLFPANSAQTKAQAGKVRRVASVMGKFREKTRRNEQRTNASDPNSPLKKSEGR